jgi:hypothetical protein
MACENHRQNLGMRSFLAKLGIYFVLVAAAQCAFGPMIPTSTRIEVVRMLATLHGGVEIVFFGDSVNGTTFRTDQDKRRISEFLAERLPGHPLAAIDRPAFDMGVYESLAGNIGRHRDRTPLVLIIPINLASFATSWDRHPSYQFLDLKWALEHDALIHRAVEAPMQVFNLHRDSGFTLEEYTRAPVYDGDTVVATVATLDLLGPQLQYNSNATPKRIKQDLVFRYMQRLSPSHRKVLSMHQLARAAKASGLAAVFWIGPVDYQTGEQYLGVRFTSRVRENIDVLQLALREDGLTALDLSLAAPKAYFAWERYPNEHLSEAGRRMVARRLHQWLLFTVYGKKECGGPEIQG